MINQENYRSYNAKNFSLLAKIDFDPSQAKDELKETEAMRFGSLFDCLITDESSFNEKYVINNTKKPTAQLGDFLDLYLEYNDYDKAYNELKERNGGKLRDGVDKFKERVKTECKDYLDFIETSKDKIVVSSADYHLALTMKSALTSNRFTAQYFNLGFLWGTEFQKPLVATIDGIDYKCLVDMLIINPALKKIKPIDIKTTSEYPSGFMKSVFKYKYHIQGSLYWDIIKQNYPDYEVEDFLFFVCSKELPEKPYIWRANEKVREIGRNGGTLKNGIKLRGYKDLANDLKWHEDTGLWDYPKAMYENEGIMDIDFNL